VKSLEALTALKARRAARGYLPTVTHSSMTNSRFSPTMTVGEIVAAQPLLSRVFERVGIDFCCGGKATLAAACAKRGLDAATFVTVLDAVPLGDPTTAVDAAAMSLTALADHIERTHHQYVVEELPILVEQAERVAAKHGERDSRLAAVAATVRELTAEMFQHMAKEEQILFPIVRDLEAGGSRPAHCGGTIAHPIQQMEHEHAHAGGALARLRELTDGFTPGPDACNTHRALLAGLARFETDLHLHVHKENNILFPRALALEARLPA
jgi:regulator of cell morphogenesis and NO signaling